VPLRILLEAADMQPGVVNILLHAADGYTKTLPQEKAMDPSAQVAY
jgi:DMSO/TMAO reductase YedYZ molybdopterin-dependent catalytic subunit